MGRLRQIWDVMTGQDPVVQRALDPRTAFLSGDVVTSTGLSATMEGTLRSVPTFAAVRLIADNFAATPLHAYQERSGQTKERLPVSPAFLTPVSGQLAAWKTQAVLSLLGYGNVYGYITGYDSRGGPAALVWLNPAEVTCDENVIRPEFTYRGEKIEPGRLLHIPWIVPPGRVTGVSPIAMFRSVYETGQAALDMARNTYVNNGIPTVHLKYGERELDNVEAEAAARRYEAYTRGGRRPFVSGSNWELTPLGLPADDVRFIEGMKLSATQVASIFGVAPEDIGGETGSSLTYATVEQNELKFVTKTMRPWYVRVEEALSTLMPEGQYVRFNADALIRSDAKTRAEVHEINLRTGMETQDEGRALEDRPPLDDAEHDRWLGDYRKAAATPAAAGSAGPLALPAQAENNQRASDTDQLKDYWTKGEGLAKWADHPHPWTALYNHLKKHMPPEKAKRVASEWFHDVKGYWPGDQAGTNPTGPG